MPAIAWLDARGLLKPLGYIGAALLAFALVWGLWALTRRDAVHDYKAEQATKAIPAINKAAAERASDTIAGAANEKDMHDAINAAPSGGALSPAAHRLACERLRKLGRTPASCGGPASGH